MDISKLLSNFKIDVWYKALFYIGSLCLIGSLFIDVKAITNGQLQLLSAGALCLGLGEWKNHKVLSWIKPANAYTGGPALMKAPVRSPDMTGILFDLIGIILLITGICVILFSTFFAKPANESIKIPSEQKQLQRQVIAPNKQIDQLVYALYGLTEEEIKIVENVGKEPVR